MSKLIDLDDQSTAPAAGGPARISTPGIHTNIKFVSITLIDKQPDPAKGKKGYVAAEFVFENALGEQHKELYMQPPTCVEDIRGNTTDFYDNVNGKKVKTRKATKEEHLKIFNNDFIYFLIDLAHALGYTKDAAMNGLKKATDFKSAVELFKKHFPGGKSTINMRLLWQNSKPYPKEDGTMAPGSSWLRLKNNWLMYYPYETDLFEPYVDGRPSGLYISPYDYTNNMVEKYPYVRPAAGPATDAPVQAGQPASAPAAANGAAEEDPF